MAVSVHHEGGRRLRSWGPCPQSSLPPGPGRRGHLVPTGEGGSTPGGPAPSILPLRTRTPGTWPRGGPPGRSGPGGCGCGRGTPVPGPAYRLDLGDEATWARRVREFDPRRPSPDDPARTVPRSQPWAPRGPLGPHTTPAEGGGAGGPPSKQPEARPAATDGPTSTGPRAPCPERAPTGPDPRPPATGPRFGAPRLSPTPGGLTPDQGLPQPRPARGGRGPEQAVPSLGRPTPASHSADALSRQPARAPAGRQLRPRHPPRRPEDPGGRGAAAGPLARFRGRSHGTRPGGPLSGGTAEGMGRALGLRALGGLRGRQALGACVGSRLREAADRRGVR